MASEPSPKILANLLEVWFAANARDLPWRQTDDPYKVWVSEIMLQQTTSEACVRYFTRFTERFPTVQDLASADESEVLKLWEGLGYYSRARNLHKTAKLLIADYEGRLPTEADRLRSLPGIGPYTAGAIASIAFNQPAKMVDANVRRLLGRALAIEADQVDAESQIAEYSFEISRAGKPQTVNQAMMELGALVCLPVRPACSACPLKEHCGALAAGRVSFYGTVRKSVIPIPLVEHCIIVEHDGQYLVGQPRDGRWKGLWEFPRFKSEGKALNEVQKDMYGSFRNLFCDNTVLSVSFAGNVKHTVTKYSITLQVYRLKLSTRPITDDAEYRLVNSADLRTLALPSPMRKIANSILKEAASGQESLTL